MHKWSSLLFVMGFFSLGTGLVLANKTVTSRDDGNVLSAADRHRIQGAARASPFGVVVWIANGGYAGNRRGFVQAANALVGNDCVVFALDVREKWSHVAARQNAGLPVGATVKAKAAGKASFTAGSWCEGIVGELNTLVAVAPSHPVPSSRSSASPTAGGEPHGAR